MKKLSLIILSGLLLSFSWPQVGFPLFIFIAFVPLLIFEDDISINCSKSWRIFFGCFISFLIFNLLTTFWVHHATVPGSIIAFLVNSFLMSLVFLCFHKVKKILGEKRGLISLIVFWVSMEYLHLHWDLAWPWLTLGNVFASFIVLVQWYEYIGVLGGSLWVLLVNIFIFRWWKSEKNYKQCFTPLLFLFIPIIISLFLLKDYDGEEIEVVVIQPNIDSYDESQFDINRFIFLARKELTKETRLLVGPETMLQGVLDDNNPNLDQYGNMRLDVKKIKSLQNDYPELTILVGAITKKYFKKDETPSSTAQKEGNRYFDKYNSAIFISKEGISVYHKTKLVPGAEGIPFPSFLNQFNKFLSIELAGSVGNFGRDNDVSTFNVNGSAVLPLICYESVFGDVMSSREFDLITIITNDGWWEDTDGYRQHFDYASLRAIEQRKSIVRSANTGISGIISPSGKVIKKTKWEEETAFRSSVVLNEGRTFYNIFGDYIGRIFSFISVLLIIVSFVKSKLKGS